MGKTVIVGRGDIVRVLLSAIKESVVIEPDSGRAALHSKTLGDSRVVTGSEDRKELIRRSGASTADLVIIALKDDHENLLWVKAMRAARASNVVVGFYDEANADLFAHLGVKAVTRSELLLPENMSVHPFGNLRPASRIAVDEGSPLAGTPVYEVETGGRYIVGGVLRGNHLLPPSKDLVVMPGDILTLLSAGDGVPELDGNLDHLHGRRPPSRIAGIVREAREAAVVADTLSRLVRDLHAEARCCVGEALAPSVRWRLAEKLGESCVSVCDTAAYQGMGEVAKWRPELIVAREEARGFLARLRVGWLESLMLDAGVPVLNPASPPPYTRAFTLIDGAPGSVKAVETALRTGLLREGSIDALVLDNEAAADDFRHIERKGRLFGIEVTKSALVGNPTIEYVEKVRSGRYDLVLLTWKCGTVTRDLLRRVLTECCSSVLVDP